MIRVKYNIVAVSITLIVIVLYSLIWKDFKVIGLFVLILTILVIVDLVFFTPSRIKKKAMIDILMNTDSPVIMYKGDKLFWRNKFSNFIINEELQQMMSKAQNENEIPIMTLNLNNEMMHFIIAIIKLNNYKMYLLLNFNYEIENYKQISRKYKEIQNRLDENNEYIGSVTHDLKTPLNAISGIARMLNKYHSDNLTNRQEEGLNIIAQNSDKLLEMIAEILDSLRTEHLLTKLNLTRISLDKLIVQVKSLTFALLDNKPVKFIVKKSKTIPDEIISNNKLLYKLLTNILGNAVKFTKKGKVILNIHLINNRLYFEVSDTGIGIKESDLHLIFEKFVKVSSNKNSYDGTGLGLSICKDIIKLFEGDIGVFSKLNEGTTVWFWIPLLKEDSYVDENLNDFIEASTDEKPIIATNSQFTELILSNLFAENNNVKFTTDLAETKNEIHQGDYSLLLIDMDSYSEKSSHDLIHEIINYARIREIKSIAIMSSTDSLDIRQIKELSFNAFITKPIDESFFKKELLRLIH